MLNRICGVFLLALAVVVAIHTVAEPLYHTSSDTQPYSPLWAILDPIMVLGIALGLVFSYARKRRVDGEGDSGPVTREFLVANTQFFGFVSVGILNAMELVQLSLAGVRRRGRTPFHWSGS